MDIIEVTRLGFVFGLIFPGSAWLLRRSHLRTAGTAGRLPPRQLDRSWWQNVCVDVSSLKKPIATKKNKLITAAKKNYRAPFLGFSFQMSSYDCFLLLKFFVCKGPYTAKAIGHNACARSNEECTRPSSDFFININNQSSASSQLSFVSIGPQPWAVSALQRSDLGKEILTRL